jgi:hypothetical protein
MHAPGYLFSYPISGDFDPLRAARRRILRTWPKLWGLSKSDRQRSTCMAFSPYGKIAARQFLIDTLRAFCESQIRAFCQGLIVHTTHNSGRSRSCWCISDE